MFEKQFAWIAGKWVGRRLNKEDNMESKAEIVKVRLSKEQAGFLKISGYPWSPQPEKSPGPPHSVPDALLSEISRVALSCDTAEVEVEVSSNLTSAVLEHLAKLGHIEIVVDNAPLHRE